MLFVKSVLICVLSFSVKTIICNKTSLPRSTITRLDYCGQIYTLACFKLDVAKWIDRLNLSEEAFVIPGVSMVLNSNSVEVTTGDSEEEAREIFPDSANKDLLIKKLDHFINNRSLKISLRDLVQSDDLIETGRGSDKDKKGDGGAKMILVSSAMVIGVLAALAMGGLTALAGKALITGAISLVLSLVLGIKEITTKPNPHVLGQPVISLDNWSGASSSS